MNRQDDIQTALQREDKRWHLDRRVSVGHLATTIALIISFMWWASQMDGRISRNTSDIVHLKELTTVQQNNIREQMGEIRTSIISINRKLDKILAARIR